jgi:hypothetical protein
MGDATEPRPGKIFTLGYTAMEPGLVHGNGGIDHVAAQRSEPRQDALLVRASGLGVSDHGRTENRRTLPGLANGASLRRCPNLAQGTGRSRPIYDEGGC